MWSGMSGTYLRFAALGDSTTVGLGDACSGAWRGWARILADALEQTYDLSFVNLAVSGATVASVREQQLREALAHRPTMASLLVGVNDTMRSSWDAGRIRDDLLLMADQLSAQGALLLTARYHDHGEIFRMPGFLRRPLARRIEQVNAAYDEVFATYGGVQVDLTLTDERYDRAFWSVDRLHPSELGHRCLAAQFAEGLCQQGLDFPVPSREVRDGEAPSLWDDIWWMVSEGAPWVGRRARDLGPWAGKMVWSEARHRIAAGAPRRTSSGSAAGERAVVAAPADSGGVAAPRVATAR